MKWQNLLQIGLIIAGLLVGAHFSKISYEEHEKLGHADLKGHVAMNHGTLDISTDSIIPKIELFEIIKDPMSGWNIHLEVANFQFKPEHASQSHQSGEGHAHLYINGNKIARLYGNWFHIPAFIKATNEVKVTLNTNDHQTLTVGTQPIEKVIMHQGK